MKRGTTPTHVFNVPIDLRDATIYVTYKQYNNIVVEKTNDELTIEEDKISVSLSQEETLKFVEGLVKIQIRYVTQTGIADASNIITMHTEEILKDGVI